MYHFKLSTNICSSYLWWVVWEINIGEFYNYLSSNNILNTNQSGLRTGDSCTNQLTVITHEIFKAFNSNPTLEVRGVFLDISKAFDKVWHEGQYGN